MDLPPFPSSPGYLLICCEPRGAHPPDAPFACVSFDLGKLSSRRGFDMAEMARRACSDFSTKRIQMMLALREAFLPLLDIQGTPRISPHLLVMPPDSIHWGPRSRQFRLELHPPSDRPQAQAVAERAAQAMAHLEGCDPFAIPIGRDFSPIQVASAREAFQRSLDEASALGESCPGPLPSAGAPRI